MGIVTPTVQDRMMAAVKSENTSFEKSVFSELRRRGIRFGKHYKLLPGSRDLAIAEGIDTE